MQHKVSTLTPKWQSKKVDYILSKGRNGPQKPHNHSDNRGSGTTENIPCSYYGNNCTQKTWEHKAGAKAISHLTAQGLLHHVETHDFDYHSDKDSPKAWTKRYHETQVCNANIVQVGTESHLTRCKHRWCAICNRARSGKAHAMYGAALNNLHDLWFITLTAQTVEGEYLGTRYVEMQNIWRKIYLKLRKQGTPVRGFKKMETTSTKGKYHPHFHILISGENIARTIIHEWHRLNPGYTSHRGQDIRRVTDTEKSIREILKYSFKTVTKEGPISPEVLHVINRASYRKRTHEAIGLDIPTDIALEAKEVLTAPREPSDTVELFRWKQVIRNWISTNNEVFLKWSPSDKLERYLRYSPPPG